MATNNNDATLLIRLPSELKAELARAAAIRGQKLNSEVVQRLENSRHIQAPSYTTPNTPTVLHNTNDKGPANALTGIDQAMLDVFRALPPEKQLALLSLFR